MKRRVQFKVFPIYLHNNCATLQSVNEWGHILPSDNLVSPNQRDLCAQPDGSAAVIFTFAIFINVGFFCRHRHPSHVWIEYILRKLHVEDSHGQKRILMNNFSVGEAE